MTDPRGGRPLTPGVEVVMKQDSTPLRALVAAALCALMLFVGKLMPGG